MALFAIGDLHLGRAVNKPMNIFGENWNNHEDKILSDWKSKVKDEDTVIIAGDISWGINLNEAIVDLTEISQLPGKKILVKGNHDYWWTSIGRLNNLFENMNFIQNSYFTYEEYAICGTRGWLCPNELKFDEDDEKIYKREINRLKLSLQSAKKDNYNKIIVVTHYPPTNDKLEDSGFTQLYEEYGVEKVVYGHIHGKDSYKYALIGEKNDIQYDLVSCDFLDFSLVKLL